MLLWVVHKLMLIGQLWCLDTYLRLTALKFEVLSVLDLSGYGLCFTVAIPLPTSTSYCFAQSALKASRARNKRDNTQTNTHTHRVRQLSAPGPW
jgi:hypothetical protein